MSRIFTIGHSSHPFEQFAALLEGHGVATLVDVRSSPYSRWVPHASRRPLEAALTARGVRYVYLGRELGGLGLDGPDAYADRAAAPDFTAALDRLIELAGASPTAIMCAEEDPTRCHRRRLIAPALRARDVDVVHIRGDGSTQPDAALDPPQLDLFSS